MCVSVCLGTNLHKNSTALAGNMSELAPSSALTFGINVQTSIFSASLQYVCKKEKGPMEEVRFLLTYSESSEFTSFLSEYLKPANMRVIFEAMFQHAPNVGICHSYKKRCCC